MRKDTSKPAQRVIRQDTTFDSLDFPLTLARRKVQFNTPVHSHQFIELVLITGGSGIHCAGDAEYPVLRGDAFVIAENQAHCYRKTRKLALVNILFDASRLGLPFEELDQIPGYRVLFEHEPTWRSRRGLKSRLRLSAGNVTEVEGMLAEMEAELIDKTPGYRCVAVAHLTRLIAYLSRRYSRSQIEHCHAFIRIAAAVEHLEAHYDQNVSLQQLAGMVHMSERHFLRAFWKAMGISPIAHLMRQRIAHAGELLLQEPEMNITEIAFKTGFQDSNYFARQFRRIMGQSPRTYRSPSAE